MTPESWSAKTEDDEERLEVLLSVEHTLPLDPAEVDDVHCCGVAVSCQQGTL